MIRIPRPFATRPVMKMPPTKTTTSTSEPAKELQEQSQIQEERGLEVRKEKHIGTPADEQESTPSFSCFAELAPELRSKIWQEAMPGPRLILLVRDDSSSPSAIGHECTHAKVKAVDASVPTLLQVSRESRGEAQRIYTLTFGKQLSRGSVYFAFNRDTLYLPTMADLKACYGGFDWDYIPCSTNLVDMKEVEDNVRFVAFGEMFQSSMICALSRFSRLEHLATRKVYETYEISIPGITERCEKNDADEFEVRRAENAKEKNLPFTIPNVEYLYPEDFENRYYTYYGYPREWPGPLSFIIRKFKTPHARIEAFRY